MVSKGRHTAIYARLSQDRGMEKVSVPRQIEECRALADRLGWDVVEVFQDRDVSASNRSAKRPGYDALLEALRQDRVNAVLARESSRLYRRPLQLEELIDLIEGKGVEIATVYEGEVDLSTSNGRMMARIRVSVDKAESERISERTRSAMTDLKVNGKWHGGGRRPFGYDAIKEPDQPVRFTVNRDEARVIREMARMVIGGTSLHHLTIDLNGRGIRTVGSGRWRPAHIKRTLLRELPPESFKPILKPDEEAILRARLANMQAPKGGLGNGRRYVLTGLLICSVCGTRMIGAGSGGKKRPFKMYACTTARGGCGLTGVGARRLEEYVQLRLFERGQVVVIGPQATTGPSPDEELILAEMADVETRLSAWRTNIDASPETIAVQTRALEAKLADLRTRLSATSEKRRVGMVKSPADVAQVLKKAVRVKHGAMPTESDVLALHDAVASVIDKIVVKPRSAGELEDRVRVEYRKA